MVEEMESDHCPAETLIKQEQDPAHSPACCWQLPLKGVVRLLYFGSLQCLNKWHVGISVKSPDTCSIKVLHLCYIIGPGDKTHHTPVLHI